MRGRRRSIVRLLAAAPVGDIPPHFLQMRRGAVESLLH